LPRHTRNTAKGRMKNGFNAFVFNGADAKCFTKTLKGKKMFWKYGVVIMLNTFLGPGIGQLVLKRYKKGFIILGISLFLLALMSAVLISSVDRSFVPQDFAAMKEFAKGLIAQSSDKIKFINYALMIVWAYSYADIIMSAIEERKKNEKNKKEEN
jgi:hypothetical protein